MFGTAFLISSTKLSKHPCLELFLWLNLKLIFRFQKRDDRKIYSLVAIRNLCSVISSCKAKFTDIHGQLALFSHLVDHFFVSLSLYLHHVFACCCFLEINDI